ncbi:Uncharacterized protein APZ42_008486, partial [Daphnia magna]
KLIDQIYSNSVASSRKSWLKSLEADSLLRPDKPGRTELRLWLLASPRTSRKLKIWLIPRPN